MLGLCLNGFLLVYLATYGREPDRLLLVDHDSVNCKVRFIATMNKDVCISVEWVDSSHNCLCRKTTEST